MGRTDWNAEGQGGQVSWTQAPVTRRRASWAGVTGFWQRAQGSLAERAVLASSPPAPQASDEDAEVAEDDEDALEQVGNVTNGRAPASSRSAAGTEE